MEKSNAVAALAALAQDNRLDVYRLLVQAGPDGLPAGQVAAALKLAPNTLTFHFDRLRGAGLVDPVLTGPERSEIAACADRIVARTVPLTWPRYALLGLPEFGTVAALDHYVVRKRKQLGDFVELRAKTREQIDALTPELEKLGRLIESPLAVNGRLSLDDIRVLPLLRSAAVVKGLRFPHKVREYFEAMMERIEYQPLTAV